MINNHLLIRIFYISKDNESKVRGIDKLTHRLPIPRKTRYSLFDRGVSVHDDLPHAKEYIK